MSEQVMSEKVSVQLNPARIDVEPGGAPAEATVALQNLGAVVEQYTVEIIGLDSDWYTIPVASVGLFPQDRDQVRVTFHPPRRQGLRARAYHFRVRVRSRSGVSQEAEGVLDVRGFAVFRLDLLPRRQTARRRGRFRVQLANSGTADARLVLEARDAEEACDIRFPSTDSPLVPAGGKTEVPLVVTPKERPWVGPERSYTFSVTARPEGARGEPQTVEAQYTYRPYLRSLAGLGCLLKLALVAAVLVAAFVLGVNLLASGVVRRAMPVQVLVIRGQVCGWLYRVPVLNLACPSGPAALPVQDQGCVFEYGFKELAEAEKALVGECTTNAMYDGFGNGLQYTTNGVLFWQKETNTVYFFTKDSLYMREGSRTRLLNRGGAS